MTLVDYPSKIIPPKQNQNKNDATTTYTLQIFFNKHVFKNVMTSIVTQMIDIFYMYIYIYMTNKFYLIKIK